MHALQVDLKFNQMIYVSVDKQVLTYPPFPPFWDVFIMAYLVYNA